MSIRKSATGMAIVVIAVCLSLAGNAQALMMWSNADGSGASFDWSDGGSDNGLFGDPILVNGNMTLVFTPDDWAAESLDGASDIASDRLEVVFTAHQGFNFNHVFIQETGDYAVVGEGAVSATGAAFAADNIAERTVSQPLSVTPDPPMTDESGIWEAEAFLDMSDGEQWTDFTLVFDNNLIATTAGPGSAAIVRKSAIIVTFLPEPGLLVMVLAGAAPMILKRKRAAAA